MSESVFTKLFRYRGREKNSPEENYLTELVSWLINNVEPFATDYFTFLLEKANVTVSLDSEIKSITQLHVPSGFIDMIIYSDKVGFICEHKVNSELSKDQIEKYSNEQSKVFIRETIGLDIDLHTVLLTKSSDQHKQEATVKIIWKDIFKEFDTAVKTYDDSDRILVEQFLLYLTEVGMGNSAPFNPVLIKNYIAALKFPEHLLSLFNDIKCDMNDEKWKQNCPGITDIITYKNNNGSNFEVKASEDWKRVGINFAKQWDPLNLFAGVLYDNSDHKLDGFSEKDFEPQLVVFVECNKIEDYENYSKLFDSHQMENFKTEYRKGSATKNRFRVFILHMPLYDLIKDEANYEKQKEIIQNKIIEGINIALACWKP